MMTKQAGRYIEETIEWASADIDDLCIKQARVELQRFRELLEAARITCDPESEEFWYERLLAAVRAFDAEGEIGPGWRRK